MAKAIPAKIAMMPPNTDNLSVSPVPSRNNAFAISTTPEAIPAAKSLIPPTKIRTNSPKTSTIIYPPFQDIFCITCVKCHNLYNSYNKT